MVGSLSSTADIRDAFRGKGECWARLHHDQKIAEARVHRAAADFRARVLEAAVGLVL